MQQIVAKSNAFISLLLREKGDHAVVDEESLKVTLPAQAIGNRYEIPSSKRFLAFLLGFAPSRGFGRKTSTAGFALRSG